MNAATPPLQPAGESTHVDVLIVGAGISGIGSAYHLQDQCPDKSYVILEMKDTFGGTWETHKYPGVRSDSDLYTFGYRFKPWVDEPIARADKILRYMHEVIEDNGIAPHIRYGHRITGCHWSSADNLWTVEATRKADGACGALHRQLRVDVPGLLRSRRRPTCPNGPAWPITRAT